MDDLAKRVGIHQKDNIQIFYMQGGPVFAVASKSIQAAFEDDKRPLRER
jgi:hypothetical protein